MTHKDFVLIAGALATARSFNGHANGVDNATECLANALATTNPRFDRARFMAAANGTPSTKRDAVRS